MARCRGEQQSHAEWLGPEFRLLDRYELQDALIETLGRTKKFSHLVPRVAECHRSFEHWVCPNRHEWAQTMGRCNVRICPHCQRVRSLRLAARWEKHLGKCEGLRYVVFAERNSEDLSEGLASLYRAWNRLRKSSLWKRYARGSVAVLEVTYNRDDRTWHPHLNVLFEGDYLPFEALNQEWNRATRGSGQTSFIVAADAGTIRELIKYVTKLSDFVGEPSAVESFLGAVARKRFIRTYGTFYRLPVEEEESHCRCPDCDSDCCVKIGKAFAFQIFLDFNGVLRIDRKRLQNSQRDPLSDYEIAWPRAPVERDLCDAKWNDLVNRIEGETECRTI